ncbi:MAG: ATP-binding cassette domain-containing protein [Myxococcota bacterium]
MTARLEVRDLDVSVGARALLAGVSFAVSAGEACVLEGRSGLGKSTLLRTLAALHADPGDAVCVDGETPSNVGTPRWRRRCLYLGQSAPMIDGTVRENLALPFGYSVSTSAFDPAVAEELLAAVGLAETLERDVQRLSGGERQRVHLVRGLLLTPAVYLLDEPVAALDAETREDVWNLLEARRGDAAMVLVTHTDPPPWAARIELERFRV